MEEKHYDLVITKHARERWVERVCSPRKFSHLATCPGCSTCLELVHALANHIKIAGRSLDFEIIKAFRKARDNDKKVTDAAFLETVKKKWGEYGKYDFFVTDRDSVMVVFHPPEETTPVLLTVMSANMVAGTVARGVGSGEGIFDRLKHEARVKV